MATAYSGMYAIQERSFLRIHSRAQRVDGTFRGPADYELAALPYEAS